MTTQYMTYVSANYRLNANNAKRLKVLIEQIASTSIKDYAAMYSKIAKKIVADCDFTLTAIEFNAVTGILDDFCEFYGDKYDELLSCLSAQAPSNDAYAPEIMAISIINEDAPDVDCAWLYDVHNDKMDGNITFSDSYRMTQGFIRGLIAARLIGIEVISDLDRSMRICGGFSRIDKV